MRSHRWAEEVKVLGGWLARSGSLAGSLAGCFGCGDGSTARRLRQAGVRQASRQVLGRWAGGWAGRQAGRQAP